jgi:hypothetical protein
MRQVARRARMQRGEEQHRTGLLGRDQPFRELARQMKAGIEINRMHLGPGPAIDGKRVIGFAPRRRCAVHEMRDASQLAVGGRKQRVAGLDPREIADPRHRQLGPGRGADRGAHPLLADIGEHRPHAFTDEG